MSKRVVFLLIMVALVLVSCQPKFAEEEASAPIAPYETSVIMKGALWGIRRCIDWEAGIVCYGSGEGMSCVPITDTYIGTASADLVTRRAMWEKQQAAKKGVKDE